MYRLIENGNMQIFPSALQAVGPYSHLPVIYAYRENGNMSGICTYFSRCAKFFKNSKSDVHVHVVSFRLIKAQRVTNKLYDFKWVYSSRNICFTIRDITELQDVHVRQ